MPPKAGLQDISPTVSRLWVKSRVLHFILALAAAASIPACPAPITITSKFLKLFIFLLNPSIDLEDQILLLPIQDLNERFSTKIGCQ